MRVSLKLFYHFSIKFVILFLFESSQLGTSFEWKKIEIQQGWLRKCSCSKNTLYKIVFKYCRLNAMPELEGPFEELFCKSLLEIVEIFSYLARCEFKEIVFFLFEKNQFWTCVSWKRDRNSKMSKTFWSKVIGKSGKE